MPAPELTEEEEAELRAEIQRRLRAIQYRHVGTFARPEDVAREVATEMRVLCNWVSSVLPANQGWRLVICDDPEAGFGCLRVDVVGFNMDPTLERLNISSVVGVRRRDEDQLPLPRPHA